MIKYGTFRWRVVLTTVDHVLQKKSELFLRHVENQENDNLNGTQPIESETLNHTPNVTLNDLNNSHSQGIARNDSKTNKSGNKLVKVLSTNLENVLKF